MTTYQGELTSQEVVKLIEAETDEGGDILEELTDQDVRGIYEQLSHEDKKRFRQFRKCHRQYFGVYGEHLPSYHMARQVVKDLMPGLPSASADVIAAKRAELLAEDRLRELCRRHGFKFPEREMRVEAPREEEIEDPAYRFPSIQDEYHAGIATTMREEIKQMIGAEPPVPEQTPSSSQATDPRQEGLIPSVIKTEPGEDVKPTLRTTVLSQRQLLQWQGTGDEELIITKVTKGNNPLADFYDDAEVMQEIIEVEETDSEDDLSEVSMQSNGDVNKAELKVVLQGLTNSHQAMANHLSTLSTMVTGMKEEQVDETAARVVTELVTVQGWQHIVDGFDRAKIALLLAVGVRKVEEFEILKGKRAKDDVTPFLRLAKTFGSNTRTIQECNAGIKYRYMAQERGPQRGPPRKLQTTLIEEGTSTATTSTTIPPGTRSSSGTSSSTHTGGPSDGRDETEMTS